MLAWPARRRMLMARLRRVAMTRGPQRGSGSGRGSVISGQAGWVPSPGPGSPADCPIAANIAAMDLAGRGPAEPARNTGPEWAPAGQKGGNYRPFRLAILRAAAVLNAASP